KSELNLDLDAGRELQTHQSLNGLVGGSEDVDKSLVGSHLKLLTAVLILMNGAQDGDDLLLGRQRDRSGNPCARALRGLHDLLGGLIHQLMIVTLNSYPDFFFDCHEK